MSMKTHPLHTCRDRGNAAVLSRRLWTKPTHVIRWLSVGACCAGFALAVCAQSTPPTIGNIGDQSTYEDQPTELVPVTIGDSQVAGIYLTLSANSSDTNIVPVNNIFFYDYDYVYYTNRSISVVPAFGQTGTSTISIIVSDGTSTATNSFLFTVNPPPSGSARFANPTPIIIPTQGMATPYPSQIVVSNMSGTISKLQLTISQFWHNFPGDVDMLLVSPAGQKMVIWSRAGDSGTNSDFLGAATNITTTLDDAAVFPLPYPYPLICIPFTPGDYSTQVPPAAAFPAPAPSGPYDTPVAMSDFNGVSPNGTWSLYVYDFAAPDQGAIEGGWSLMIATVSPPTISGIADQSTPVNTTTPAIPFTIGDAQTAASNLVLTVTSSNPALVPTNNIAFGGSDTNRTITLTPLADQMGTATITVTVTDGDGMSTNDSFVLTVSPAQLTVTIDSFSRAYGATNPVFTGLISGLQSGDDIGLSLSTGAAPASPVGSYAIVPTFLDPSNRLGNYTIVTNGGTLTVTQASLTVTASSTSKTYGQPLNFAGTEFGKAGLVNGDTVTTVSLSSDGAASTAAVASYNIIPSGAVGTGLGNYTIYYVNGTLTVNPATLTVAAASTSRVYGATNPVFTVNYSGFASGDGTNVLSGSPVLSTGADTNSPVGNYTIQITQGSLSSTNYGFSFTNGVLTVTPYGLTVTANSTNKVYGQSVAFAGTEFTAIGLVNSDTVTNVSLSSAGAAGTAMVGSYGIVVTNAVGTGLTNYTITYTNGTLTVNAAALTITANSTNKTYGQALSFAGTEFGKAGLVNGDSVSSVSLSSAGAAETAGVGSYAIAATNAVGTGLTNYTIGYTGGTLTVNPAPLTITAKSASKTYGNTDPALTYQLTGNLYNGDTLSGALSRVAGENVGSYAILQNTLGAGSNYTNTYQGANLRILQRYLLVLANNASRSYGQTNPVFTVTYTGFATGDGPSSLSGTLVFTTSATPASSTGTYSIAPSGLSSHNYSINFANGTLTITPPVGVRITSITPLSPGNIELGGNGDTNVTYTIQTSPDLVHWQSIGTATSGGSGLFQFQDSNATNSTALFYRTSLP